VPDPYIGQISIVACNYAPRGSAMCNGQLLPINQNQALFSLLGTTYGGNGQTTFALPDLRGRAPVHASGGDVSLGQHADAKVHTLTLDEMPQHAHAVMASNNQATTSTPVGTVMAVKDRRGKNVYGPTGSNVTQLNATGSQSVGGSQPHDNMQPSLTLNFVIALLGIFPSRT
jgi:microcystin-dependent protein